MKLCGSGKNISFSTEFFGSSDGNHLNLDCIDVISFVVCKVDNKFFKAVIRPMV